MHISITSEDEANWIKSLVGLLGVLVWPAVVVFFLTRFRGSIESLLNKLGELRLKFSEFEISLKAQQAADASAALTAANIAKSATQLTSEELLEEANAAAATIGRTVTSGDIRKVSEATVLWVDDNPENNRNERRAFEALGVRIVLSKSTEDALAITKQARFDVIISDMGRISTSGIKDERAGYTLLDALRASGNQTALIFYAGSRSAEHIAESRQHGALGCTNRPDELFQMVIQVVSGRTGISRALL